MRKSNYKYNTPEERNINRHYKKKGFHFGNEGR